MAILTNENYVKKAEVTIKNLQKKKNEYNRRIPLVTTSKIRNLLAISADIFNEVRLSREDKLSDEVLGRINYLKIRFFYEAGRDKDGSVRAFLEEAEIVECINEIGNSKAKYLLFNRYMEALIAYHKFYHGKDW